MKPSNSRDYNLFQAVIFKVRGLAMVPMLVLLTLFPRWETENVWLIYGLGVPVFLGGIWIRVWSQRHLRYRLKTDARLAVTGPSAHVRNPVYIGNTLILCGLALLCELPWAVPLMALWAAAIYSVAVRFEENRLLKRYGDEYQRYMRCVPRWIPSIQMLVPTAAESDLGVSWFSAARVEWQCALLLALPIFKELVIH